MEILTFAAGLVAGAIGVDVRLDGAPTASLRLDGREVCVLEAARTRCDVDLGHGLSVHRLDLVRVAEDGREGERVTRWLNRPGVAESEVRLRVACDEAGKRCVLSTSFVHPDRFAPSTWSLTVDGKPVESRPGVDVVIPPGGSKSARVVALEAFFPDGRRAAATRLLGGPRTAGADEAIQAVPIEVEPEGPAVSEGELGRRLGGRAVRAIETGETEAVFVVDPLAARALYAMRLATSRDSFPGVSEKRLKSALERFGALRFVHPESNAARVPTAEAPRDGEARLELLHHGPKGVGEFQALKIADAVAAAGLSAASSQRRRLVVLLLGEPRPDKSRFSPAAVRSFLAELMVPLVVLRTAERPDDPWGEAPLLKLEKDVRTALNKAADSLERQRIAWLAGDFAPGEIQLLEPKEGLRLAGRPR